MELDAADRWEASHTFRYNDCYAWCSKMCIALILLTEAWNSLPSGSCWQQACGTDTAQVSRHGWSWMGQLKLRMIIASLSFSTLRKLNYDCYRSRGAFRVPELRGTYLIQHLQLCHLALIEWHLTVREGTPSMQMLAKIIVFIESKSFPCSALWVEFGSHERQRVALQCLHGLLATQKMTAFNATIAPSGWTFSHTNP